MIIENVNERVEYVTPENMIDHILSMFTGDMLDDDYMFMLSEFRRFEFWLEPHDGVQRQLRNMPGVQSIKVLFCAKTGIRSDNSHYIRMTRGRIYRSLLPDAVETSVIAEDLFTELFGSIPVPISGDTNWVLRWSNRIESR